MGAPTCPTGFSQFFMADPPDPATGCDYQCVRDVPPFDVISATCDAEPVDDCYVSTACNCTTTNCHDLGKECCAPTRTCVDFVTPPCTVALNCIWSPNHCDFLCDNPTCPPGQTWNGPPLCRCVTDTPDCDPPNVFCKGTNTCIGPPPKPQCGDVLECTWNETYCQWLCEDPCVCPTGYHWDWDWCMCVVDNLPDVPLGACHCDANAGIQASIGQTGLGAELYPPWRRCTELFPPHTPGVTQEYLTYDDSHGDAGDGIRHCVNFFPLVPGGRWLCYDCPPGWWLCDSGFWQIHCPAGSRFACYDPRSYLESLQHFGTCLEYELPEPVCPPTQPWTTDEPYWCECGGGGPDGEDDLGGAEPWNLENSVGQYYSAFRDLSRIRFRRAPFTIPPYELSEIAAAPPSGYVYGEPAFIQDWRHRHILLFSKLEKANPTNVSVMEIVSDDDGKTWSDPTTVFTGARKPRPAIHPSTGAIVRMAYKPGTPATVGTLVANIQYPGDAAPGAEFTVQEYVNAALRNLSVTDAGFGIAGAADAPGRWLLICTREGEGGPSDFQSWDECKTFTPSN